MKKLVFVLALLSGTIYSATAQTAAAPAPQAPSGDRQTAMAQHQASTFRRLYNLTDEQYKGVYEACLDQAKKIDEIRATGKQPTPQQSEAMNADLDARFKKVMNADQYSKFESTRRRPVPQKGQ